MGVNAYHMIQEIGFGEPKLLTRMLGEKCSALNFGG